MATEHELSQFLYQLTKEILTSGDYSDCNINQICGKHYETSSYPDRDRLRRLVSELKRKLKILQYNEVSCPSTIVPTFALSTCPPSQSSVISHNYHRCGCPRSRDHIDDYCPYPPQASSVRKTTSDKCVETTFSTPVFSPTRLLINDSTQFSAPRSFQSYATGTACGNSACSNCGNLNKAKSQLEEPFRTDSPRSSEDSNTLVEQLLLKHASALQGDTSSEILLRLAAGDRVLCESCHGKCPLHQCGRIRGRDEQPPVCSGKCDCGPSCRSPRMPTRKKQNCDCPLKRCKHFDEGGGLDGGGSGGSAGLGKQSAILQQENATPPITCCGARRKKERAQRNERGRKSTRR
ncbi:uncharacterized protein LOC134225563 [Armigeres subalbatus]|uniref:uncharacterized protein LOC134225563 n=1 Tax=Armigeres subalbatus TaxID=124917 RepID=UPI002ED487AF